MPGSEAPGVRDFRAADLAAVTAIYAHHVRTGFGTFETAPPSPATMAARIAAVQALGLPWLVAEAAGGAVAGFAYASAFRPRAGYRYTAEDSVYVAPGRAGQGFGRALLNAVIARCRALGVRQLIAIIGDSGNAASIGLHRQAGFDTVGTAEAIGFKRGRWLDIVWMQKALAAPDAPVDPSGGLPLVDG